MGGPPEASQWDVCDGRSSWRHLPGRAWSWDGREESWETERVVRMEPRAASTFCLGSVLCASCVLNVEVSGSHHQLSSSFLPCDLKPPLPTPSCLSLAQTSLLSLQPQERLGSIRYHPLGCRRSRDVLSLRHLYHQGDVLWAVQCLGLGLRGPEGRSEEP